LKRGRARGEMNSSNAAETFHEWILINGLYQSLLPLPHFAPLVPPSLFPCTCFAINTHMWASVLLCVCSIPTISSSSDRWRVLLENHWNGIPGVTRGPKRGAYKGRRQSFDVLHHFKLELKVLGVCCCYCGGCFCCIKS